MKTNAAELENVLRAYRSELERLDTELPALLLGSDAAPPPASQVLRPLPEELPDLAREIDAIWERLEERRIAPGPSKSLWNVSAAALAGLAIGGAGLFAYRSWTPIQPPSRAEEAFPPLPFPAENAAGLVLHRGAFLSLDIEAREFVVLDPGSSRVVRRSPFPAKGIRCVSPADGGLLAADEKGWLYRLDPSSFAILEKTPLPGTGAAALHWDGNSLWSADDANLYRLSDGPERRVLAKAPGPKEPPVFLVRVGEHLWAAGEGSPILRRYSIAAGLRPAGSAHLGHLLPAGGDLRGAAVEDGAAWFLAGSPAQLIRVPLAAVTFSPD